MRTLAAPRAVSALLTLLTLTACDGTGPERPGPPAALHLAVGDAQTDTAAQELPLPLVVRVTDAEGRPVPGQAVDFRVVEGSGSVLAGAAITDARGEARDRFTLGTATWTGHKVMARVVDQSTGATVAVDTFWATAVADVPAAVTAVTPTRSGTLGQPVYAGVSARVADRFDNPVQGVTVTFAASGGGQVGAESARTGLDGRARVGWTLGNAVDDQRVVASMPGLAPAVFTAVADLGSTTAIVERGGGQSAPAGAPLPDSVVVRLQLPDGRPVIGQAVQFVRDFGSGTVSPEITRTDAQGRAATRWTLGDPPGDKRIRAFAYSSTVAGTIVSVEIRATATATP